jgi:hypothetical protein
MLPLSTIFIVDNDAGILCVNNMPTLIYHWTNYVIAKHALISNIIHNIFNLRYTKIALFIYTFYYIVCFIVFPSCCVTQTTKPVNE